MRARERERESERLGEAVGEAAGRVVVVRFSSGIGAAALVSSGRLTEAAGREALRTHICEYEDARYVAACGRCFCRSMRTLSFVYRTAYAAVCGHVYLK